MQDFGLQQLEFLFFLLLGLIFLILTALIIYVVIANRRQRAEIVQKYEEQKLAPRPSLQIKGKILSLFREEAGGTLQVEVSGNRYRRISDIEDPQVRRRVIDAAMELIQFTGVLGAGAIAPARIEETHTWREDMRVSSQTELSRIRTVPDRDEVESPQAPEQVQEQFLSMLADMGQGALTPDKPGLVSSLQQRLTPKLPESERPRTFVDDIEDIIQRRVQLIPALAGRDLHVRPGPGGSVHFVFEGKEYQNLDEVPNLTARQLIKDAIQEWDETT